MGSLADAVGALWRRLVTPPAVRAVEDADPQAAVDALLPPAPPSAGDPDRARRLRARIEGLEARRRLYARERGEGG